MATFNFETGNSNIDGKIDYSYTRAEKSFTIRYTVYMRRNNSYSGTATHGTINYTLYIDKEGYTKSDSSYYTVPNNKTWAILVSGTKTYSIDNKFSTTSFKIGFSSTTTGSKPTAFKVSKQMSGSIAVSAYTSYPSLSSITMTYNAGDNYFTFGGTIGNNGTTGLVTNEVTGCKVFYTTNGSNPSATNSSSFTITGKEKTRWTKKINIPARDGQQQIKVKISTLAKLGSIDIATANTIDFGKVAYYSPPYPLENLQISYNASKPSPNSTYDFSWELRNGEITQAGGYNNDVKNYEISIFINNNLKLSRTIGTNENLLVQYSGKDLGLIKGDKLSFSAVARGTSNYNNISASRSSNTLEILSAGIVNIKYPLVWQEGQVWLKTTNGWIKSTEIYTKTSSGWKQST